MYALGLDIGGTKCAVTLGRFCDGAANEIVEKRKIDTTDYAGWQAVLQRLYALGDELLAAARVDKRELCGVGISCGGPLDSAAGVILSPPNLPGWDRVPIVALTQAHFGVHTVLCNDADACAVAEWKFGAGQGCDNLVFLTFGTGMGAGLILNGRLYTGANNMAGEVGHIRLCDDGPIGYGKSGSFEGFCSGGGLARSAEFYRGVFAEEAGKSSLFIGNGTITARDIAAAAAAGDRYAERLMIQCAHRLGQGLAVLIDVLNPEKIIIGSIFARNRAFFEREMMPVIRREALPYAAAACQIVPAALGEQIGDYAALGAALLS